MLFSVVDCIVGFLIVSLRNVVDIFGGFWCRSLVSLNSVGESFGFGLSCGVFIYKVFFFNISSNVVVEGGVSLVLGIVYLVVGIIVGIVVVYYEI